MSLLITLYIISPFSSLSIVDFEIVIVCWDESLGGRLTLDPNAFQKMDLLFFDSTSPYYYYYYSPHENLNIIGNLEKFMSTSQKSLFQNRVSYYLVRKTPNNKTNLCFLFVIFRSNFFCSFICVRKSNHYNK